MKAILVDDEPAGIQVLTKMLQRYCPEVEIIATCSNAATARQIIRELAPDVVFLDIQMPEKSGLDLLHELERKEFEVIFVTAHNQYLLQALQYSAADYLLKPVEEDRLIEAVQRVGKRLGAGRDKHNEVLLYNLSKAGRPIEMRLCLPTQKGFTVLKLEEIIYCEAERSYTVFHLENRRTLVVSKPLAEYESLLKEASFLRVHKSFLVNLLHIKEYLRGEGGLVVMSNNAQIEVSRRKKEYFLQKIREDFKYS